MIKIDNPDVDKDVAVCFLRRVRREGPLGNFITDRLDKASRGTRQFCAQLAASCGCAILAQNLGRW